MKTIFKIAAALALVGSMISCHDDITIPDPGFDMSETVFDTLRRDTSSVYHIAFNVKAPNGVRFIQLLNGRTYEVIQEFDEYAGKKNFEFSHDFDLSGCDPERDSIFIYNIKISTNDNRGYNKSIRILHMRKSHPEISGPSTTMNVFGRAFVFDGTINTGYYPISSIRVTLNGDEVLNLGESDLGGATTYRLYQQLTRDFVEGQKYVYSVTVSDNSGQTRTFDYNLVGAALKKPVAFKYATRYTSKSVILHYNDKGQVEQYYDPFGDYYMAMHYDEDGRLITVLRTDGDYLGNESATQGLYGYGLGCWYEYNDDGSIRRYCDFGFSTTVGGVVHKMLDPFWNRKGLLPESCLVADLAGTDREGFIRSCSGWNDYTLNKYMEYNGKKYITDMTGSGSNHIGPFEYLEDFEEGKLLYTNVVNLTSMGVHPFYGLGPDKWAQFKSFVPVLNPLYIPDLPTMLQWRYCGANDMMIWGCKYVPSSVVRPNSSVPADNVYQIPYTVREDGLLKSFGVINYSISTTTRSLITYYYDDEPTDGWEPYVIGSEDKMKYMK